MKDYAVAFERAGKIGARLSQIDILLDEGIALDWLNDFKGAAAVVTQAEEMTKAETPTPALKARLLMAMGRSAYRGENMQAGCDLLTECVAAAEPLGEEGYEAYTQGMMMLAFVQTNLGKLDEATAVSDKCIAVSEEKQDAFTLCSMLQNRGFLSFMLGKIDQLVVDVRRSIQTSREFGFPMLEALNIKDLGEVYFYLGRPDEAEPCAARAVELYTMIQGERSARVAYSEVAFARIKAYRGDVEGALALVEKISQKQELLKADPKAGEPLPLDGQFLLDDVALWCRGASDADFDALLEKGRALPLQPPDIVEIMEFKALSAVRTGRREDGVRFLEAALAEAEKNAQVVADRLRRQLQRVAATIAA